MSWFVVDVSSSELMKQFLKTNYLKMIHFSLELAVLVSQNKM